MELKPLPRHIARPLGIATLVITAPVWGPFVAIVGLAFETEQLLKRAFARKDGWRFVWLPVQCDPWPDDGFTGWVWLETAYWTANPRGFSHWRRLPPQPSQSEEE
jgi:hypothetical protein